MSDVNVTVPQELEFGRINYAWVAPSDVPLTEFRRQTEARFPEGGWWSVEPCVVSATRLYGPLAGFIPVYGAYGRFVPVPQ